jgi:hypothetical protein
MPHAEIKKKAKAKSSNKPRLGNVRSLKFDGKAFPDLLYPS